MRERLRMIIAICFYYSGLIHLANWWMKRSGQYLVIINYHRALGKNLRQQMRYLQRHYRILHLEDALEELYTSDEGAKKRDQRPLMALTFDDGYLDNYIHGWKLARELHIPITIFPVCSNIEDGKYFSWLAGKSIVSRSRVEKMIMDGQTYHLKDTQESQALALAIHEQLRHANSIAEREQFLEDVQRAMEASLPSRAKDGTNDLALPLTWAEIREMEQSGLVSFGAHTVHHPVLAYLKDAEEVRREVTDCRTILEERLGHPVRTFAYPVGKRRHISDEVLQAVKAAGYTWAVTTIDGVNTRETDPYLLRRLPGDITTHWLVMAAELSGLLGIMSRFRKK